MNGSPARDRSDDEHLGGLIPIAISFVRDRWEVEWHPTAVSFVPEPFIHQSVAAYRVTHPDAPLVRSDVESIIACGRALGETVTPTAIVFHAARCGSTLLANALRTLPDSVVVSEPEPVNTVLLPHGHDLDRHVVPSPKREMALTALLRCLVRGGPLTRHRFVKLTSWNVLFLPLFRACFPSTPFVFVGRDPRRILDSVIRTPTRWMRRRTEDVRWVSRLFGWPEAAIRAMTASEFGARAIGMSLNAASEYAGSADFFYVDYESMTVDGISSLLAALGLTTSHETQRRLAAALTVDAKSPGLAASYVAPSRPLQALPEDLLREAARWADAPYRELRSIAHGCSAAAGR